MKLRAYQRPSRLESLLDSLVKSHKWIPAQSPRVTDRSELSSALQKLAINAVNGEGVWRAWCCYDGVRLFVTEMSAELSRERGQPALKVSYYDEQGSLQAYGLWIQVADDSWRQACYE